MSNAAQDAKFVALFSSALAAGMIAGRNATPTPMVVSDGFTNRPIAIVDDGPCGFAWVAFAGNTAFGRWAKRTGNARSHYPRGLSYWVSQFGQSITRKEAFAHAMAATLRAGGIECHSGSRMD